MFANWECFIIVFLFYHLLIKLRGSLHLHSDPTDIYGAGAMFFSPAIIDCKVFSFFISLATYINLPLSSGDQYPNANLFLVYSCQHQD